MDSVSKLVTPVISADEQKMIERHIQFFEILIGAKRLVLLLNIRRGPDDIRAVIGCDAVALQQEVPKIPRQLEFQLLLDRHNPIGRSWSPKLGITRSFFDQLFPGWRIYWRHRVI